MKFANVFLVYAYPVCVCWYNIVLNHADVSMMYGVDQKTGAFLKFVVYMMT